MLLLGDAQGTKHRVGPTQEMSELCVMWHVWDHDQPKAAGLAKSAALYLWVLLALQV